MSYRKFLYVPSKDVFNVILSFEVIFTYENHTIAKNPILPTIINVKAKL